MAKIRDTATVYLSGDVPKFRRGGSSNLSRSGRVQSYQVDRRVWKYALSLVDGDASRLKPIDEFTVQIKPES